MRKLGPCEKTTTYKYKHNAELRKTAPAAKVSCHKCSYAKPPQYDQKWQFHTIFLDTFIYIFSTTKILGQNVWPVAIKIWKTIENVSRYRPKDNIFQILCSWVDGQKIPEKRQKIPKKRPYNGQKSKFWKTIENLSRYRPKDNIFKTLCSYAKNYVHEVKNSIIFFNSL